MKSTLIILTLMCNACYGQDTAFYNRNTPNYVDSALNYWHANIELIDSIFYDGDTTHMILKYHKDGKYYTDTIYLTPQPELKWYDGVIIFDSVTMYGNDPPVYHRKKDTVLTFVFYVDTTRQMIITNDYHTLIKPCDNCMVSYKQDTTYYRDHMIQWTYLYSVRELHNYNENGIVNGQMQYQWRVMGENGNNYWKHLYYLNSNKEPLSENVVVWQSIEIKNNK